MVKYGKMILGIVINIVLGLVGPIVWIFMQDSVRMAKDDKSIVSAFFFAVFVPAVVFFIIWYMKNQKFKLSVSGSRPNRWLFCGLGIIFAAVIAVVSGLVFAKAIVYAIVTLACVLVGSVVAYAAAGK